MPQTRWITVHVGCEQAVAACEALRDGVVVVGPQLDQLAALVGVGDEPAPDLAHPTEGLGRLRHARSVARYLDVFNDRPEVEAGELVRGTPLAQQREEGRGAGAEVAAEPTGPL